MISTYASELLKEQIGILYQGNREVHEMNDSSDVLINNVTIDSREVKSGCAFIAIRGEHVDGHDFVATLPQDSVAVVDHIIENAACLQILVTDTIQALGEIARLNIAKRKSFASRGMNEFTIIGITGSVGKTTTKDMLYAVLSRVAPTVAPQGSFNNNIGLPLTALKVDEKTRFFVAEMGASAKGEIAYLTTIAPPDISIVLKVGVAHLGGFGSVEGIRDAKSEIVRALTSSGVAILNADDAYVRTMADMTQASSIIWFSRHSADEQPNPRTSGMVSSVITRGINSRIDELNRAKFTVVLPDGTHFDLRLGISGEHNVYNALAVLSVIYSLDIPEHIAGQALSEMTAISAHRMHIAPVHIDGADFTVIDDSFNANPDSMRAGLVALGGYDKHNEQLMRIAVLGSMLELGPSADEAHREIGAYATQCADVVISVGSDNDENLMHLAQCLADGANDAIHGSGTDRQSNCVLVARTPQDAHDQVINLVREHPGIVLLKGSHASGLSSLATKWLDK